MNVLFPPFWRYVRDEVLRELHPRSSQLYLQQNVKHNLTNGGTSVPLVITTQCASTMNERLLQHAIQNITDT